MCISQLHCAVTSYRRPSALAAKLDVEVLCKNLADQRPEVIHFWAHLQVSRVADIGTWQCLLMGQNAKSCPQALLLLNSLWRCCAFWLMILGTDCNDGGRPGSPDSCALPCCPGPAVVVTQPSRPFPDASLGFTLLWDAPRLWAPNPKAFLWYLRWPLVVL